MRADYNPYGKKQRETEGGQKERTYLDFDDSRGGGILASLRLVIEDLRRGLYLRPRHHSILSRLCLFLHRQKKRQNPNTSITEEVESEAVRLIFMQPSGWLAA